MVGNKVRLFVMRLLQELAAVRGSCQNRSYTGFGLMGAAAKKM